MDMHEVVSQGSVKFKLDQPAVDKTIDIARVLQSNPNSSSDNRAQSAAPQARRHKTLDYVNNDTDNTIKNAEKPTSVSGDQSDYVSTNTKTVKQSTNFKTNKTATCGELKAKSNFKICLKNYTIKRKYQEQMQNFFTVKNFELITPYEHIGNPIAARSKSSNFSGVTGKTSEKEKGKPATLGSPKKSPTKKDSSAAAADHKPAINPYFIVPADENVEKDKNDLNE